MSHLVTVQEATPEHHNLIKSTWLKSYLNEGRFCENLPYEIYNKNHSKIVEKLMARSKTLVAMSTTTPDVALGYIVFEDESTVHYSYVKWDFRRFGIFKDLFKAAEIRPDFKYTHRTTDCAWLVGFTKREKYPTGESRKVFVKGIYPSAVYDPYGAFT